jgi:toxin secretion/phage lysis holin
MSKHEGWEQYMEYGRWGLAGIAAFLNSIPQLTWLLIWLMVLDTVFGVWVAVKRKDLSVASWTTGVNGKLQRLAIIVLGAILNQYIDVAGIDWVQVTTVFYLGPELLSILRNAAILGIPVPEQLTGAMRYFQEKENDDKNKSVP